MEKEADGGGAKKNRAPATTRRKRGRSEGAHASSLTAKKARKNCHKVKGDEAFVETTPEERRLLDVSHPLDDCMQRLKVVEFVNEMRRTGVTPKINIPITNDFVFTIQNVVMTVELRHKRRSVSSATSSERPPLPSPTFLAAINPGFTTSMFTSLPPTSLPSSSRPPNELMMSMFTSNMMHFTLPSSSTSSGPSPVVIPDEIVLDSLIEDALDENEERPAFAAASYSSSSLGAGGDCIRGLDGMDLDAPLAEASEPYYIALDELTLNWRLYGAQHNNRRFTAVILRNHELSAASLVFSSGNIVCTGSARSELALWLLHSTLDKLRKAGYDNFEMPTPQLRNIVSSGCFPNTLCTSLMAVLYSNWCKRADKFPGTMVTHHQTGKRVALVFDSGKICHSGAHSVEEIKHDMAIIYPMLVRCQYTVENQKDDEECARMLDLIKNSSHRDDEIENTRKRIEQKHEQHKKDVQERRIQSAQLRVRKAREQASLPSLPTPAPQLLELSDDEEDM